MVRIEIRGVVTEIRADFFMIIAFMLLISESNIVLISLFSSIFHELGHIAAICLSGEKPERIVLSASGMRIDRNNRSLLSFSCEIFVAFSGAMMNLLLCGVSYAIYIFTGAELAFSVACVNSVIAFFNLLPVESLDGAGVLYFFLCRRVSQERAVDIINNTSLLSTALLIVFFCLTVFMHKVNPSLVVVIIYLVILLINRIFQLKKSEI